MERRVNGEESWNDGCTMPGYAQAALKGIVSRIRGCYAIASAAIDIGLRQSDSRVWSSFRKKWPGVTERLGDERTGNHEAIKSQTFRNGKGDGSITSEDSSR